MNAATLTLPPGAGPFPAVAMARGSGPQTLRGVPDVRRLLRAARDRGAGLRPGHDFSWTVLHMTHTPPELPTGLLSSLPQSSGFEPRFYPAIGAWLRSRAIVRD